MPGKTNKRQLDVVDPTIPNTFLISGTKMASISTTPRIIRVAVTWISHEKGRLPHSSKITALRAGKWMSGTVSNTDTRMASRTVITMMSRGMYAS